MGRGKRERAGGRKAERERKGRQDGKMGYWSVQNETKVMKGMKGSQERRKEKEEI